MQNFVDNLIFKLWPFDVAQSKRNPNYYFWMSISIIITTSIPTYQLSFTFFCSFLVILLNVLFQASFSIHWVFSNINRVFQQIIMKNYPYSNQRGIQTNDLLKRSHQPKPLANGSLQIENSSSVHVYFWLFNTTRIVQNCATAIGHYVLLVVFYKWNSN